MSSSNQARNPRTSNAVKAAPNDKKIILVVGMHRSGTSALTGLLSIAGAQVAAVLNPPADDNPKGYWEPAEIVALHDELLAKAHSAWDDVNPLPESWYESDDCKVYRHRLIASIKANYSDDAQLIAVKDPRVCKLMPLWADIAEQIGREAVYVIPIRNPHEVADSLSRRDSMRPEKSWLLWLSSLLDAEYYSRGKPRAFVDYAWVLKDYSGLLKYLESSLGISFSTPESVISTKVSDFISEKDRHHRHATLTSSFPWLFGAALDKLLARLFAGPVTDDESLRALFDSVRAELEKVRSFFANTFGDQSHSSKAQARACVTEVDNSSEVSTAAQQSQATAVSLGDLEGAWSRNTGRIELCLLNASAERIEIWRNSFRGRVTCRTSDRPEMLADEVLPGLAQVIAGEGADIVVCVDATTYAPRYFDGLLARAIEEADALYPNWAVLGNDGLEMDGETRTTLCFATDCVPQKSHFMRCALAIAPHLVVINRRSIKERQVPLQLLPERWSELALTALCYSNGMVTLIHPRLFTVVPHELQRRKYRPEECADTVSFFEEHTVGSAFFAPWGSVRYQRSAMPAVVSRETIALRDPRVRAETVVKQSAPHFSVTIGVRTELTRKATLLRLLHSIQVALASYSRVSIDVLIVSSGDEESLRLLGAECQKRYPELRITYSRNDLSDGRPSRSGNCVQIFRESASDYVWFVDDDDFIEPECFNEFSLRMPHGHLPFVLFDSAVFTEKWHRIDSFDGRRLESHRGNTFSVDGWRHFCSFTNPLPICSVLFPRALMMRLLDQAKFIGDFSEDYAMLAMGLSHQDADVITIRRPLAGISWRGTAGDNVVLLKDRAQWYQGYADFFAELLGSPNFLPPIFWTLGRNSRAVQSSEAKASDDWKIPILRQQIAVFRAQAEQSWRNFYAAPEATVLGEQPVLNGSANSAHRNASGLLVGTAGKIVAKGRRKLTGAVRKARRAMS